MSVLPGREAVVEEVVARLRAGGRVVLDGPAGIGKTAVWRAALARCAPHAAVLSCAPTEAESALPLAALADLLRPLAPLVDALPPVQRAAAGAVLLDTPAGDHPDGHVLGATTRALLDAAGGGGPVVVAVDDAPWLDPPSERALRFALRRVRPGVAVLLAVRGPAGDPPPLPLGLDDALRVPVAPLGPGALHHVLRDRLGAALPRPLLGRIAEGSGGNPLLAIELARAVLRLPALPRPGADLPVRASLRELLAAAVAALPPAGRDAVRLAALLSAPRLPDLVAAGVDPADLDPAEEAGLLAVGHDGIAFAHPLHAAAVRAGIPPGVRRGLHRRLADVVADPDERARQLAAGTGGPDPAVAAEVAAAARRQQARGAPELAAGLFDIAVELTPDGPARDGLRLEAARCRYGSGDYAAAAAELDALVDRLTGAPLAEALMLRAVVAWSADGASAEAERLAERGLAAVDPGTPAAGRIHAHLSVFRASPDAARADAEAARRLLAGSPADRPLLSAALLTQHFQEVRLGLAPRAELFDEAIALEDADPHWLAATVPAIWWRSVDAHAAARDRLTRMLERATARGDEPSQHELLGHLGETELHSGRWADAAAHTEAATDLGDQLGTGLVGERWLRGMLAALRGDAAVADELAAWGLGWAAENEDPSAERIFAYLAGCAAAARGDAAAAAERFAAVRRSLAAVGLVEPLSLRYEPEWVEACVATGDLPTARRAQDLLAERHARLPRPWTGLGLARGRVLLAAASGEDTADAVADLLAAREATPPDVVPLDRARCLLVAGVAQRRARRRAAARTLLGQALAEFEALGAAAWAARAASELDRTGGRTADATALTPTEERVARLAAQGRTNRLIAEELFVSPKTVEANLARAYRKLGITTRAQLGAVMGRTS
ncbi:helix-turn-helix transcriptional regulator [Actinokineospora bangkokensis]|uniref:LuxR family transcriptional regulator n=1 Tax=Actinokineospora bangkokensis TaxID=1193682 RepID=A0A1Q9LRJ3_9PSEU|nr:helix-turn-helix transcriptional regulator [Actinokineospora bangkokensis]OLR94642.1 LuxR family transcriptional regulator [Actinokineospora bangkokensis]